MSEDDKTHPVGASLVPDDRTDEFLALTDDMAEELARKDSDSDGETPEATDTVHRRTSHHAGTHRKGATHS